MEGPQLQGRNVLQDHAFQIRPVPDTNVERATE
jgi:hypothetical protein